MKKLLRISSLLLSVLMIISLASCKDSAGQGNDTPPAELIEIYCSEGFPRLCAEKIITDHSDSYKVTVVPEAQVHSAVAAGEADIALCSVVCASRLYSQTSGKIRIAAAATANNLYVAAPFQEDFPENFGEYAAGKKIYAAKNSDSDAIMSYLLLSQGIDCELVSVDASSDSEVFAAAKADNAMCVVSEPYLSCLEKADSGYVVLISVNDSWKKICDNKNTPIACCAAVSESFAQENPQAVENFLSHYQISVNFLNYSNSNPAAAIFTEYGFYPDFDSAVYSLSLLKPALLTQADMHFAVAATLEAISISPAYSDVALPDENIFY